mgnify:CR=1 FL=1
MIVTSTEQGVIDQYDRWIERRNEYSRTARECNHLALATLQGYANVKASGANIAVGDVYKCIDSYWQVLDVGAQIDADRNGVRRIDVYVSMRGVDGAGNPHRGGGVCSELLATWQAQGYALTEIVGAPWES